MNSTSLRRIAVPAIATLTLGLAVSACGNDSGGGKSLKGAGSSAQESAMDAWRAAYQKKNSDVTVNYDPAGSGAGVEQFNAGTIDYAGSDAALDPSKGEVDKAKKRCGAPAIEVPDYVSPIAIIFNVQGVKDLKLDAKTIASIFAGTIKKWNDPAIAKQNPGVKLPALAISPVHRSDKSGTTKNFTDYLQQASGGSWKSPADDVWPIKSGEGANQTSGMVSSVKGGKGTIGYADNSQAKGLSVVSVKVGSGFVKPSADGAAKALTASPLDTTRDKNDLVVKVDRTTTAAGAYPVMLTSYLIACPTYKDKDKADMVKGLLSYIVSTDGQQAAGTAAGSAPLPANIQQKASTIVSSISAK